MIIVQMELSKTNVIIWGNPPPCPLLSVLWKGKGKVFVSLYCMEKVYLEWIENTIWIIENDICTLHSGSNIGFLPQFRANVFANSKKFCAPKDSLRKYFTSQISCVTSLLAKSSMNVCNVCKIQKWSITGWDKKLD